MKKWLTGIAAASLATVSLQAAAVAQFNPDDVLVVDYNVLDGANMNYGPLDEAPYEWTLTLTAAQDLSRFEWFVDALDETATYITFEMWETLDVGVALIDETLTSGGGLGDWTTYFYLDAGTYDLRLTSDGSAAQVMVSAVPIPAAALLFGTALLGFAGFGARRKV